MPARNTSLLAAVVLLIVLTGTAVARCPLDAIATHSSFVGGAIGSVAVETCVTRSGTEDTYTYTLTDLSVRALGLCSFAVAGVGVLGTTAQEAPSGWTGAELPAGSCASWWAWSTIGFGSSLPLPPPRGLIPGGSLAFSVTVEGPTTPAFVTAQIQTCGGKPFTTTVLGPSACPEIEEASYETSCSCSPRGCTAVDLFEGDGNRILVIGGPDTQTIPRCEPSWVRHGFLGPDLSASDVEFRLWIDGTRIPLVQTELCTPGDEPGGSVMTVMWHTQFPPDFFDVGLHEVVGEWEAFDTPDTDPFVWSRTITLEVVPCAIPVPSPPPELPDISLVVVRDSCNCGWTQQQQFVCDLEVVVDVKNEGAEPTGFFQICLSTDQEDARVTVPSLQPGQDRRLTLELTCRLAGPRPTYRVVADCSNRVQEIDEENNSVEQSFDCR